VYLTVTSAEAIRGITHHRAGTDDLAGLHLEAAALWEQLGEQTSAALRAQPDQRWRLPHHPREMAQAAARHRAHALGYTTPDHRTGTFTRAGCPLSPAQQASPSDRPSPRRP
jgi:hypothetical protein